MTTPFTQYLDIKDNYCLSYFGEDTDFVNKMLETKDVIEKELPGIRILLVLKDHFVKGQKDVIAESKMGDLKGKVAWSRELVEKEDLNKLI